MNEQDVLRIVRNMLSHGPHRLLRREGRNGASGFVNLLDEVILEEVLEGGLEDITEEGA